MSGWKRIMYALVLGGLGLANVNLALARHDGAEMGEPEPAPDGRESGWWKNYHWHKTTIRSSLSSSNNEAVRAINVWNSRTILSLPSASPHTDISVLRGAYGPTGWRGLAQIKLVARDPHCNNGYCEIRHCHASLNTSYAGSSWRYEGTYCMEMGHCFGLAHDSDVGCMNSSAMNTGKSNTPSADNARAINGRYSPYLFK